MTRKQTENSINLGRIDLPHIGPVWVSIHLSVPLGLLFLSYDFGVNAANTISLFLVFLLSVGIHEGAHLVVEQLFGYNNQTTRSAKDDHRISTPTIASLTAIGVWWSRPWNFRWTYLAGPIANLLAAGYILAIHSAGGISPREWNTLLLPQTVTGQLFLINAWLGIMNFISSPPADLGFAISYYFQKKDKGIAEPNNKYVRLAQWILFPILALAFLAGKLGLVIAVGYLLFTTFRATVWNACLHHGRDIKIFKYLTPAVELRSFRRTDSIESTLETLMTAHQDYFPITELNGHDSKNPETQNSTTVLGVIERTLILSSIAQGDGQSPVTSLIDDTTRRVSADEPIASLFHEFHPDEEPVCIIEQNGIYTGLVFPNKIAHVIWVKLIDEISDS